MESHIPDLLENWPWPRRVDRRLAEVALASGSDALIQKSNMLFQMPK